MFVAVTAATAASFAIRTERISMWAHNAKTVKTIERYINRHPVRPTATNATSPPIGGPSVIPAEWLPIVQDRIYHSIAPVGQDMDDGRWVSQDAANSAIAFFEQTSDLLPSEPHIYCSRKGDLVAEFETERGSMTAIVTQSSVIVFAVIDGIPIERKFESGGDRHSFKAMRRGLKELRDEPGTGQHGAVDTRS